MDKDENIIAISSLHRKSMPKYVIFVTKNGMIKKTLLSEYLTVKKNTGIQAIKLAEDDTIANVNFMDEEDLILVTSGGYAIRFSTKDINSIGRVTAGVRGIKLLEDETVISGIPVHKTTDYLAVITTTGMGKKVALSEFTCQGRGGRGVILSKEPIAGIAMVDNEDALFLVGKPTSIGISVNELPLLSRTALGNMMIKNSKISKIIKL